jgi:hypothetical protein
MHQRLIMRTPQNLAQIRKVLRFRLNPPSPPLQRDYPAAKSWFFMFIMLNLRQFRTSLPAIDKSNGEDYFLFVTYFIGTAVVMIIQ